MKEKKIRVILIAWCVSAVIITVSEESFCHSAMVGHMGGILFGISIIAVAFMIGISISCLRLIRESNRKFFKLWEQGDINACIAFAESELKKDIATGFTLNAKSNLLMAYYRIGDSESGKKLLYETKWGNYKDDALYFFILDSLADGNLSQAQRYYRQLCRSVNKRKRQPQIEVCRRLLNNTAKKAETEASSISSIYPIVGEIVHIQNRTSSDNQHKHIKTKL